MSDGVGLLDSSTLSDRPAARTVGHGGGWWNPPDRFTWPTARLGVATIGTTDIEGDTPDWSSEPWTPPMSAQPDVPGDDARDSVGAAGRFRIYLGASTGVGKTIAMLDEAHRRRQRGADVVIGLVETHGRRVTQARMSGLEVVPCRQVEYRNGLFEEMDLDALLRRNPDIALVDELAHTNVPGSGRHEKRWQDVLELLDAGMSVITTVNIQHVESLVDVVERIIEVPVRERVPDWVVRGADQIELVDSSPEQLRRRLIHGNICPPDDIPQALDHFFRPEKLTALRELALRYVADQIDDKLLELVQHHDTSRVWDSTDQVMVCVTAAPGGDAIVRRAARIASRARADLLVVHVTNGALTSESDAAQLQQLRQMSSDVGATWFEIDAGDPVGALIDFARMRHVTEIVIGSSQRSRWQELIGGGSVVKKLIRRAADADVDVHIIARRDDPEDPDDDVVVRPRDSGHLRPAPPTDEGP